MASVILPEAAKTARVAISATGVTSISLLEIMGGSFLHEPVVTNLSSQTCRRERARAADDDRVRGLQSESVRSRLRCRRRAVFLDERFHHLDRLHRVGRKGVLVDEGVVLALQELQVHGAPGLAIVG